MKHIGRFFVHVWLFIRFTAEQFIQDDCMYRASALAFTSLLAVVPLMALGLGIFSSFPVFHDLAQPVQDFIFDHFVPSTGKVIQGYLEVFAAQVSKLSVWGLVFLIASAVLVMFTIEQAMNKIWKVHTSRQGVAAFLLYWAILSLAPLFLGLSLAATSYLISIPFFRENHAPSMLISAVPYLFSMTGFTFLYMVVPNHRVKLKYGLAGAFVATVLFESAKIGFAFYLKSYNTYTLLYGTFAILPLFFIWVYWVWVITLLGAEISYACATPHEWRLGRPTAPYVHALLWLHALWRAQQHHQSLTLEALINSTKRPYEVNAHAMLSTLLHADLIHGTEKETYRLSQDLHDITLYELARRLPFRLPFPDDLKAMPLDMAHHWLPLFLDVDRQNQQTLNLSIADMFSNTTPR